MYSLISFSSKCIILPFILKFVPSGINFCIEDNKERFKVHFCFSLEISNLYSTIYWWGECKRNNHFHAYDDTFISNEDLGCFWNILFNIFTVYSVTNNKLINDIYIYNTNIFQNLVLYYRSSTLFSFFKATMVILDL